MTESLEDSILNDAALTLQEEIDWDVLCDILNNTLGWTKISIKRYNNNEHAVNIHTWIEENCKNTVKYRGNTFLFEDKKDAAWFSLKWL